MYVCLGMECVIAMCLMDGGMDARKTGKMRHF